MSHTWTGPGRGIVARVVGYIRMTLIAIQYLGRLAATRLPPDSPTPLYDAESYDKIGMYVFFIPLLTISSALHFNS